MICAGERMELPILVGERGMSVHTVKTSPCKSVCQCFEMLIYFQKPGICLDETQGRVLENSQRF